MKRGRNKFLRIFVFLIIILLILAGIFFSIKGYINWRGKRNQMIFQQGIQFGYTEAILQIINISDSCEIFPVYAGNETRELISVSCLG